MSLLELLKPGQVFAIHTVSSIFLMPVLPHLESLCYPYCKLDFSHAGVATPRAFLAWTRGPKGCPLQPSTCPPQYSPCVVSGINWHLRMPQ
ncbi:hypothetical protein PGT21_007883 [Puccinia graminis f. sp. tritici]|uniref:Uncharacterized protein n=1 Tax=Puccinia graminis f. sp. tritici TaxID=56615 RepID=A0A5B0LZN2_PUCGR|nr:hypothetical protein PGT21_007883 [Puccinia graminis f. sp. tritici]